MVVLANDKHNKPAKIDLSTKGKSMIIEAIQKVGDEFKAVTIYETKYLNNEQFVEAYNLIKKVWVLSLEMSAVSDLELEIEVDQKALAYEQLACWESFRDWYVGAFGCTRLHGSTEWIM